MEWRGVQCNQCSVMERSKVVAVVVVVAVM